MEQRRRWWVFSWLLVVVVVVLLESAAWVSAAGFTSTGESAAAVNVTYDGRAIKLNGQRKLLVAGAVHYPRSTPAMWPHIMRRSKAAGLDVIQAYVFWNMHEPVKRQYDFTGRADLVRFLREAADAGLLVNLRIGPYVCAEWNLGGFPFWLREEPGIQFRTNNDVFKREMQTFVRYIVDLVRNASLFSWQGGPVILAQIENEYEYLEPGWGDAGRQYVQWAADMAIGTDTGVPWIMCKQPDAPGEVINTCNGHYCDGFLPNSPNKPVMWTEAYPSWFQHWGESRPNRPVEDLAFAIARFYARGGTYSAYYMWHGGTNYGRTAGGPFIITSYDYNAPLDEFGLERFPDYDHLAKLHGALHAVEKVLLSSDAPAALSIGPNCEAHVYENKHGCAAFLSNKDALVDRTVSFHGKEYRLPAWSVSILKDCHSMVHNTAEVAKANVDQREWVNIDSPLKWSFVSETPGIWNHTAAVVSDKPMEQLHYTKDDTDYFWYSHRTHVDLQGQSAKNASIVVPTFNDVLHVFVNGELSGTLIADKGNQLPVVLKAGANAIDILSMTVGLQNFGIDYEFQPAGIRSDVLLAEHAENWVTSSLTPGNWSHQVGIRGVQEQWFMQDGSSEWQDLSPSCTDRPLTWFMTKFDNPVAGIDASVAATHGPPPVVVNMASMGKGTIWVNGHNLGRYWPQLIAPAEGCNKACDYRGTYDPYAKCRTNCGQSSQIRYFIPPDWLQPTDNHFVALEEIGGNPEGIKLEFLQSRPTYVQ